MVASSESLKARIIAFASQQFLAHGYSRISTSELAESLGMSKTTLYKFFPSKEALLEAVIDDFFLQIRQEIEHISQQDRPGSWKLERFLHSIVQHMALVKTFALQDIQRMVPAAYEQFEEQRRQTMQNTLSRFFEERVAEGIFRRDLDQKLVVQIMIAGMQSLANPEFLRHSAYSFEEMCRIVATLVLEGNLTAEGRRLALVDAVSPPQSRSQDITS
jgi:AcrR family transcriptional regulator